MPRESKRAKLLDSLVQDTLEQFAFAGSVDEANKALENGLESYAVVRSFRCSVPRVRVPKSQEWYSTILASYDDTRFKMYLRVTRYDFGRILSFLEGDEVFKVRQKVQMPVAKQLAIALYKFGTNGTGSSMGNVAALFGVGDGGTIMKVIMRIIKALLNVSTEWIKWPTASERSVITNAVSDDLPNCVGFIDGSHIDLEEAPRDDPEAYFDRKQNYSIQLQAICDWNKTIRHIQVGYPGSTHDARVFINSDVGRHPEKFFSAGEWIAGDSAYPVGPYVLTPFRKNATFSTASKRKKFNKYFASRRVKIECCFGILKETFGSLKQLRIQISKDVGHRIACQWITACCVLYNMITEPFEYQCDDSETSDDDDLSDGSVADGGSLQRIGEEKRKNLFHFVLSKVHKLLNMVQLIVNG